MASRWLDTGQSQYYRPYIPSDSEDTDWESSDYESLPDSPTMRPENAIADLTDPRTPHPDFRQLAQALQTPLTPAAGTSFTSEEDEVRYSNKRLDPRTYAYPYKPAKPPKEEAQEATRSINTGKSVNSVIMLQSRDRDRRVYPQPTACQLLLPRDYKKITNFSIAQINLTSAFFYFSQSKNNIAIQLYEQGAILYSNALTPPPSTVPRILTNYIREGSYNISSLLSEIQLQLNKVPIFYDFPNGFNDFQYRFQINGDYSLNFNYPGDNYYDALRKVYVQSPTKTQIVSYYFQSQYANKADFAADEVAVAYYYPVLKEFILDPDQVATSLDYTGTGLTTQETINYLIYSFKGIEDPIATTVVKQNTAALDTYRLQHTFRYSLVNQYNCSYNTTNNRVIIQSTGLNSSLAALLNTQYAGYLSQQLAKFGISSADYNNLALSNTQIMSILQQMYDIIQSNFATYFAVSYGTYSRAYYATLTNTILIDNGFDASGVKITYDPANPVKTNTVDILTAFRTDPPKLWPRMTYLGDTEGPERNMGGSNAFPEGSNFPYNIYKNNIDLQFSQRAEARFIDSCNFTIYTDATRSAGDIIADIQPGKYTIFQFRSKCRQTLQVETMPRPINYRYPAWNKANLSNDDPRYTLFDTGYSHPTPTTTAIGHITPYNIGFRPMYGWSNLIGTTSNFAIGLTASRSFWDTNADTITLADSNGLYYSIQTPSADLVPENIYKFALNITFETADTTNFATDLYAFFYHDIGALSADLASPRDENPLHYKSRTLISKQTATTTLSFTAYANQNYYVLLRPVSISPDATNYRVVPWFPNGSTTTLLNNGTDFDPMLPPACNLNYYAVAKNNDPDYIRMPVDSTLWGRTPPDQPINQIQYKPPTPIGYDSNGISTDMTDYVPCCNSTTFPIDFTSRVRIDPITNYIFQLNAPYDPVKQSYTTGNVILTPGGFSQYTPTPVAARQYKILNYNSPLYIQNYTETPESLSPYITPYKDTTTGGKIKGYAYDSNADNVLRLGEGVCGFMFIPAQGTWAMDRITFKTNFIDPNAGTNKNIHLLAVYYTADVNPTSIHYLNPMKAVAICLRTNVGTYSNANLGFDSLLGTYYTFSNCPQLVIRTDTTMTGFDQMQKSLVTNKGSYYSAIAYNLPSYTNSNWNNLPAILANLPALSNALYTAIPATIQNLTGSAIPYPYANTAFTSNTFYDGQEAPNKYGMVLSTSNGNNNRTYGPSILYDESALQYEQSIAWVNSHLHYTSRLDIIYDSNAFHEWAGLPLIPNSIHASVPNHMLFNGGSIAITKYTTYNFIIPNSPPRRTFSNAQAFTVDLVFPYKEETNLLAISGNNREYCFLGATPTADPTKSQLRFKVYNPITRILSELPTNSNYTFSNSLLLQGFVFHNTRQWYLSASSPVNNIVVFQGDTAYQSSSNTMIQDVYPNVAYSELQMDPAGAYVYLGMWSLGQIGFTTMRQYSLNSNAGYAYVRNSGYVIGLGTGDLSEANPLPESYSKMCVNTNIQGEQVFFTSFEQRPNYFFKLMSYQQGSVNTDSNAEIIQSPFKISDSNGNPVAPSRLVPGAGGSLWLHFESSQTLMANRNDAYDVETGIDTAWQIFFPTLKIQMRRLTNNYNPILDLTSLDSNTAYPEWPHVAMFSYQGYSNLIKDIGVKGGSWGNESKDNFLTSDISFNGFYFGSYIANIPILPNFSNGSPETDYYLAVRGWLPTEEFQTYMRFYMPNQYDFGYVRIKDISDEIVLGQTAAHPNNFKPQYLGNLLSFNNDFVFSNKIFGANQTIGFPGATLSSSNFGDFMGQYKNLFSTLSTNELILYDVQSTTTGLVNEFISSELRYILPSNAWTRQRFTDPLLFQIRWASQLSPNYQQLVDQWGLGWNLGYAKQDTGFSMIQTAPSFYKIQEDYIYLRLNPEFNINRMDSGSKENYTLTREPGGTTNRYYAKLLLTSFGGNATTFIHNPVDLTPAIYRLSKLEFQWIGPDGLIIDNADAEWDMVVNITEIADVIPREERSVTFPQNVAFRPVRKDAPSIKGDALSEEELETLTEPEPAGTPVEDSESGGDESS